MVFNDFKNLKVEKSKVESYLLNLSHSDGGAKAKFFLNQGFEKENWAAFAQALKQHAISGKIVKQEHNKFGYKVIVDGVMETPYRKTTLIRTVWFLENKEKFYKLVTAYPVGK